MYRDDSLSVILYCLIPYQCKCHGRATNQHESDHKLYSHAQQQCYARIIVCDVENQYKIESFSRAYLELYEFIVIININDVPHEGNTTQCCSTLTRFCWRRLAQQRHLHTHVYTRDINISVWLCSRTDYSLPHRVTSWRSLDRCFDVCCCIHTASGQTTSSRGQKSPNRTPQASQKIGRQC